MAIGKTNAQRKILLATPNAITPNKSQQTIITPEGYDGMDQVTVNAIPNNYIDTTIDKNAATKEQILSGKQAYANGSLITGDMSTVNSVSVSLSSTDKITGTLNLNISPSPTSGYISGNKTAAITDSNLKASNIKNGVTIFGVEGNYIDGGKGYASEAQSSWGGSSYEIKCTSQPKLCFVVDKLGPMYTTRQVLWAYYDFTNGIGQACLFNNGSYFGVYSAYASWDGSSIYISCSEGGNFLQNRFYCYGYAT